MNKTQLKKSLHELLQQSRGDKQVSSCYLDTEQGIDACGEWLGQQLARGLFHAYDAQGKDSLIASLKQAINENWDPKAKSLALFWSLGQGSSLLFAIPLPLQISNRISVYRQPDIRPILPLLNAESNLTILAYRSKQMQVFDVNLGQIRPVAWALAPHLASPYYTSQNEPRGIDSDKRLKLVCLSLINSKHKPLMLAASSEDLAYLRQWLPRAISWNLDAHITVPHVLGETSLPRYIEQQFRLHQHLAIDGLLHRLLNSVRSRGPAVTGSIASLRALQQQQADRLVVTDAALNEHGGLCANCGAVPLDVGHADSCAACGHDMSIRFHHVIESCWMAYEQGLPVYQVESDELQYLGGMGCILERDEPARQSAPKPVAQPQGFDLVA